MTAGPGPRASPAALVGSTVGNSFTLDKLLAQGRHGALFDGRHSRLGQHYAVRVLALDSGRRAALLGALSQCGAVVHPNLNPVREVIALPDEQLALCTPLLPGLNLSQRVALQGKLTAAEGTVMMRQAASALHALHQRGLVHGGLSAENLFFTQHDDVAVDNALGSSKGGQLVQLLDAGLYVSTLQPGQAPLSAADDQQALGKLVLAHVADLSPGQRRALERTLEGRPESRYPSVRDLWQAFDAAKAVGKHGPTGSVATALVPKITLADLKGASGGRRSIVIAGSALVGLSLVLGLVIASRSSGRDAAAPAPVAVPAVVHIAFDATPAQAVASANGRTAPAGSGLTLQRSDSPVAVTISAEGYQPKTLSVIPSSAQTIAVTLARAAAAGARPATRPEPAAEDEAEEGGRDKKKRREHHRRRKSDGG